MDELKNYIIAISIEQKQLNYKILTETCMSKNKSHCIDDTVRLQEKKRKSKSLAKEVTITFSN